MSMRLALGTVVTAAALGMAASPASAVDPTPDGIIKVANATGGGCNGDVDAACTYCSYDGSSNRSPSSHCTNKEPGYKFELCGVWALNHCYVG